jgi:hypothetical protein
VAESSRDAEFALDNTLFRFGWRFDVAIVEAGQLLRFGTPRSGLRGAARDAVRPELHVAACVGVGG